MADSKTPPSVKFKSAKELEEASDKLAKLTGQIIGVPGVGAQLQESPSFDPDNPWGAFDEERESWDE